MFDLIAIAALVVSAICAIGSSLWALKVYRGKHDEQTTEMDNRIAALDLPKITKLEPSTEQRRQYFMEPKPNTNVFISYAETLPEGTRNQLITLVTTRPPATPVPSSEDWKKAASEAAVLVNLRLAQGKLNLDVPYIDYTQFIKTSRPEDVEDLLRGAGRYRSLT